MKLFILDDNQEIRAALQLYISQLTDWTICGEADNLIHGLVQIEDACPDIILVDTELRDIQPKRSLYHFQELVTLLSRLCPSVIVIGWSAHMRTRRPH